MTVLLTQYAEFEQTGDSGERWSRHARVLGVAKRQAITSKLIKQ